MYQRDSIFGDLLLSSSNFLRVPHNQIPVKLEEAVAHLCRCCKAAKNSPEGDGAEEAACKGA